MYNSIEEDAKITTIERHILEQQHYYPQATGVLTNHCVVG